MIISNLVLPKRLRGFTMIGLLIYISLGLLLLQLLSYIFSATVVMHNKINKHLSILLDSEIIVRHLQQDIEHADDVLICQVTDTSCLAKLPLIDMYNFSKNINITSKFQPLTTVIYARNKGLFAESQLYYCAQNQLYRRAIHSHQAAQPINIVVAVQQFKLEKSVTNGYKLQLQLHDEQSYQLERNLRRVL